MYVLTLAWRLDLVDNTVGYKAWHLHATMMHMAQHPLLADGAHAYAWVSAKHDAMSAFHYANLPGIT
jgi:hypothetical protein